MTDTEAVDDQRPRARTAPHPALRQLDRLAGRWQVSGENIAGQVAFEWMEGGFFLMQRVDLVHDGRPIRGVEYIGYDPDSESLASRYFGNQERPFAYTWEIAGDTLTIWFGAVGAATRFAGSFGDNGNTVSGRWDWPGGGYASSMTRIA